MTVEELKEYLKALAPPVGMEKPNLDRVVAIAVETAFKKVWSGHWWVVRQAQSDLTTVASQAYVDCPKDFEHGGSLTCQIAGRQIPIRILSPNRFDEDHPYPANDNTDRPREAKLLHNANWDRRFRLYLWPVPDEAYTLPLTYFIEANVNLLPSVPSYMLGAIIEYARHYVGYIGLGEAKAELESAIEQGGGFITAGGRHGVEEDFNYWPGVRSQGDGPGRWYTDQH